MKKSTLISSLFVLAALNIFSQNGEFPKLIGPYLGQKPPGMTPEIFAPGFISRAGFRDYGITFSRKGDLLLYTCDPVGSDKHSIYFSSLDDGFWSPPRPIPFSADHSIGEPVFSPLSDRIYFGQLRANAGGNLEPYVCVTRMTPGGWDDPVVLFPGLFASETRDGTLYFTSVTLGGKPTEKSEIARSERVNGRYIEPELLGVEVNTEFNEFHPFVSPDESYLIFDSDRPGGFGGYDLYVAYKDQTGRWGKAANLGREINSDQYEGVATVSLDGQYLFFNREDDIYWASTKVIDKQRPKS